jgi:alkanesulfonate monooxygenase SsuD/methylene tetrahydromethanopterin reductase-like flavin-dependent oxidoreductase (luciferase family)
VLAQKGSVLNEHCERLGRDPAEIKHSAQAIVVLSDDPEVVEKARGPGRATIAGNADELKQVMQDYIDAGVDEFIVPDFNLGRTPEAKKESYDRFFTEVASEFRD